MRGYFITLEGNDFSGKSTQVELLKQRILKETGSEPVKLREPGGTKICEDIRTLLKTGQCTPICELLLFNAARNQLVDEVIRPEVERGSIVICDRFLDSTMAYQYYGNGLPYNRVTNIIRYAVGDMVPNLTILLELGEEEAAKRAQARNPCCDGIQKYDAAGIEFKKRVAQGYKEQATMNPERIVTVQAHGTLEEVHERIWAVVSGKLVEAQLLSAAS